MLKYNFLLILPLISLSLGATEIDTTSPKNDDVKFAIEIGSKGGFWNPGLSGNVMDYDAEGLYLGFGKLKVKLYDSDVFTIEKYGTLTSSNNQNELLAEYKDNKKRDSTIDGMKISLQLIKVINYLFDKAWLDGLGYEFNTRDFIGSATLLQNVVFWRGKTQNGVLDEDYFQREVGQNLSFKTKFTSHKLFYRFEDIIKQVKGSYISTGIFDEEWSKPTYVGDKALNDERPIVFDANYYSQGISGAVGIKNSNYDIKAYLDYGINNEMKVIQKDDSTSKYNRDIDVYEWGLKADYKFPDVYSNNLLTTDIIIGARMQYNQIIQNIDNELDAEVLYGVNTAIEIIF